MKDIVINKSFNFILNHKKLDHIEKLRVKYGLEVLYHLVTKCTVILLIALFIGIFKEVFILFVSCLLIRKSAYGVHAKTNIGCWISTLLCYIGTGLFLKYVLVNSYVLIFLNVYSFVAIVLWAPSDTKGKPIINSETRKSLKKRSIISFILILLISVFFNRYYRSIITFGMLISTISLNPIVYYICNCPRNNYLNYK